MPTKKDSVLYTFDLLGIVPQLRIFNNSSYKSSFSTIISIIILIISILFSIYSIVIYARFENPTVTYSRDNDKFTDRSILLKDTLLMLQLIDPSTLQNINSSNAYYEAVHLEIDYKGNYSVSPINIEICELGKNIDLKYKEIINDIEIAGYHLKDFYCISSEFGNKSLYYTPNVGFSYLYLYPIFIKSSNYTPERMQNLIISESDIIDHNNKNNPINKSYIFQFTTGFNSNKYTRINYYMQYIKYESDLGLFFRDSRILNAKSFSSIDFYQIDEKFDFENNEDIKIGEIIFQINKANFDNYKRSYQKIQSLITDVTTIVNLLFSIGRFITNIALIKKMNKDILKTILNESNNENNNFFILNKNNNAKELIKKFRKSDDKSIDLNRTGSKFKSNAHSKDNLKEIKIINSKVNQLNKSISDTKIIENLNYFHIIKSFLCFKDKKIKLINLCNNIINEDICIEKILNRIYYLETINYNFSEKYLEEYKNNINMDIRFHEIKNYMNSIIKEEEHSNNLSYKSLNNIEKKEIQHTSVK